MIPDNISKIDRDDGLLTALDITPNSTATFKLLGIGITDYGIDFGPSVEQEKWICEKNSRTIHEKNEKQGSVTQTAYKNDPVFEFVAAGRDQLNYKTHILDVDLFDGTTVGNVVTAPAKLSDGIIAITKWMADTASVEYTVHYCGDPKNVTATINYSTGEITYTEVSL